MVKKSKTKKTPPITPATSTAPKRKLKSPASRSSQKIRATGKPRGIQAVVQSRTRLVGTKHSRKRSNNKKKLEHRQGATHKDYTDEQVANVFKYWNDPTFNKNSSKIHRETGVPRQTIDDWLKKKKYTSPEDIKVSGASVYLTKEIEDELVTWLTKMAAEHFAVPIGQFLEKVEQILKRENIELRGESGHLSRKFVDGFVSRNPSIEDVFCTGLDGRRAKTATPEVVNGFFDFVETIVKKYQIKTFFNLDETGFSGEECKKRRFKVLYPRLGKGQK